MRMNAPVQADEEIILDISGLGSSGEGVGRCGDFAIFVRGALPGEKARVRITQVKKNYATASLEEILSASRERVQPPCPVYEKCGGCQLQHLGYAAQLEAKRERVREALARIGHIDAEVLPVLGDAHPWHYRNKMQFPVSAGGEGKLEIGCYAPLTHEVVGTEACLIAKEANNAILQTVRRWMEHFKISAYDEKTGKGLVRHVMGRVGARSGEAMAVLVTSGYDLPHASTLVQWLREDVPGLACVLQNINKKRTNVIMGAKTRVLAGSESITDSLGDLHFHISAPSFFQVNSEQAEKLYNKALEFAAPREDEIVADVYCGTGTLSLYLARHARKVYGIEIVPEAIADARKNALENKCANAEFFLGDAAEKLPELAARGIMPAVILLDPPRAGCEERVLEAVALAQPRRIVYVSCNPASLARDLARLAARGYRTLVVQPVDLFPHTAHVECVCLVERKAAGAAGGISIIHN